MGLFYSTKKESVTIVIHINYFQMISQVFWIQIKTKKNILKNYSEKNNIHKNKPKTQKVCKVFMWQCGKE